MTIGALGEIAFLVSQEQIRTPDKIAWSGKARWAVHQRHLGNALTEFTGLDPDEIEFDLHLSAYLGTNPMEDLTRIWSYERQGRPVPFVLGGHGYGKHLWVIEDHKTKLETTDRGGNVTSCTVSIKLLEYMGA